MKLFGTIITFLGGIFVGLSGLEKILIFASLSSFNPNITSDIQEVKAFTPEYIWSITNYTFGFGIALFLIGIVIFLATYLVNNKTIKDKFSN
ncbi:hypothetical protein E3U55_16900 [Filobacillus milosensis]|uniref:Uncharacterized protein n=1 Tax=Filobacillus milosensis TaxID=94137 RepID=A0A4Y8ICT8_9BACI|nr:hypothetical protein [Filobacillus milosensis]TFB12909.1 hypothetical protein E3U55_16900 [Filobacillus milosensis]